MIERMRKEFVDTTETQVNRIIFFITKKSGNKALLLLKHCYYSCTAKMKQVVVLLKLLNQMPPRLTT